jgi:hypothetical protein
MIPKKFVVHLGIFIVPLVWFFRQAALRRQIAKWQPMGWFFAVYVLALVAFMCSNLFLSARYSSLLQLLSVPLIAVALKDLLDRLPRWRYVFVGLALLTALANVISISPRKTQYRAAGQWLAEHAIAPSKIYIGGERTAYLAGPAYRTVRNWYFPRYAVEFAANNGMFDYYVFEVDRRDSEKAGWIRSLPLVEVEKFANRVGDSVIILKKQ